MSHRGDLTGALAAYQASLAIHQRLATADPRNTEWQRDLSVSHERIGDVHRARGDLTGSLDAYQASNAIRERLAVADPDNTEWQHDLSVSLEQIGDTHQMQGDLVGALAAYQTAHSIRQRLVATGPTNIRWQRGLIVSHFKLAEAGSESGVNYQRALKIALSMQQRGILAPSDAFIPDLLHSRLKALHQAEASE